MTPLEVGITGGMGSGKSLVARIFVALGIPVYEADHRAKSLMTTDGILMKQIAEEFGSSSFGADGQLNRTYLAEQVFGNPERLQKLNQLVHPRVGEDYRKWVAHHSHYPVVMKEAAILLQTGIPRPEVVIVVEAPRAIRINRVSHRDTQRPLEQIEKIMNEQVDSVRLMRDGDYLILNDDVTPIIPQILYIHQQLNALAAQH